MRNTRSGESDYTKQSKNFCGHNGDLKKSGASKSIQFRHTEWCLLTPAAASGAEGVISTAALERVACLRYHFPGMFDLTLGCLKWAAVGFIVAFFLMKLFEASHIHDDIPKPAFKIRQTKRATLVLSTFAAMLSALVWLLVQKLD